MILGLTVGIGFVACGGSSDVGAAGNTGGAAGVGGSTSAGGGSTGGSKATAGSSATGGSKAVGGSTGAAGAAAGGTRNTGGMTTAGGAKAIGGMISVGGASATGGSSSTGGAGGTSAIQQACATDCVITTGAANLSACQIADCPTTCVKYYDVLAAVSANCSNAFLSVLECGASDPTGWSCQTSSGVTLPVPLGSCLTQILALSNQLSANGSACANALSAAQ